MNLDFKFRESIYHKNNRINSFYLKKTFIKKEMESVHIKLHINYKNNGVANQLKPPKQ